MHDVEIEAALATLQRALDDLARSRDRLAEGLERAMSAALRQLQDFDAMLQARERPIGDAGQA